MPWRSGIRPLSFNHFSQQWLQLSSPNCGHMFVGWFEWKNKLLVAPPTLTYLLRARGILFTFSTSPLKPLILGIPNCTKILSDPFPPKFVHIRSKLFKMAAWRNFEYRRCLLVGFIVSMYKSLLHLNH